MGLDMELEFDEQCRISLSSKPSTPPNQQCLRDEKKKKPRRRDELLIVEEDFTEITFGRYRSASCKGLPSRTGPGNKLELKRGSVYQTSREVMSMKKMGTGEGRKKISISHSRDKSSSVKVADPLCSSEQDSPRKRSQLPKNDQCSLDGFLEKGPGLKSRKQVAECELSSTVRCHKQSTESTVRSFIEDSSCKCEDIIGPLNDGNSLLEKDSIRKLHKSLSSKLEIPYSPCPSESDRPRASPKSRFAPIRKMMDPFMKSKSQRSSHGYAVGHDQTGLARTMHMKRNATTREPPSHESANTANISVPNVNFTERDSHYSAMTCSPAHLHGCLKLTNKHGAPFFEFSLKCPEDVLLANTWRADNASSWVYTFHSISGRKNSNASGRGLKDSDKESSMVGQMQVSCYLCSEWKDDTFDNSLMTEFVLYDIAHATKSTSLQERSNSSLDVSNQSKEQTESSVEGVFKLDSLMKGKPEMKHSSERSIVDTAPYPWEPAYLHPDLQAAAIVIQIPFEKRESLKYKSGDKIDDPRIQFKADCTERGFSGKIGPTNLNVVIPSGNHSLPNADWLGPSPLLDRWRLGGGCECGGWDMACPLIVFGNSTIRSAEDLSHRENRRLLDLFAQGGKEKTPALTMTAVSEGQYAIDFHARLSSLQAFSICVAVLHGSEASAIGNQKSRPIEQCNSLKVFTEDEVKYLFEAVTLEEKMNMDKRVKEIPPTFVLNPPFSPMSRV